MCIGGTVQILVNTSPFRNYLWHCGHYGAGQHGAAAGERELEENERGLR